MLFIYLFCLIWLVLFISCDCLFFLSFFFGYIVFWKEEKSVLNFDLEGEKLDFGLALNERIDSGNLIPDLPFHYARQKASPVFSKLQRINNDAGEISCVNAQVSGLSSKHLGSSKVVHPSHSFKHSTVTLPGSSVQFKGALFVILLRKAPRLQ